MITEDFEENLTDCVAATEAKSEDYLLECLSHKSYDEIWERKAIYASLDLSDSGSIFSIGSIGFALKLHVVL